MVDKLEPEVTRIGKDVIESLTLGMYKDSKCIYREYVQNSADQIDKAHEMGILKSKSEAEINITIDKSNRTIVIYDTATGIEADSFLRVLRNIAKSSKDKNRERGFRGIGRLAGLAYCDSLIFETSYINETKKSMLRWDAKELKRIINNRETKEDATYVIDRITNWETEDEDPTKHYFKVILENVSDDSLLDKKKIREYLSMVAPVPFNSSSFKFAKNIYEYIREKNHKLDEYAIYVNSDQLRKSYTNYLYSGSENSKSKYDEIGDVEFFELSHSDELIAWGWIGITSFNGYIPKINPSRCIRLRKGNIQIGMEDTLQDFHKENRGNSYFVGEVHALSVELIPNSQRDFFQENETFKIFQKELSNLFCNKFYKLYHLASNVRSNLKPFAKAVSLVSEVEQKEKKGYKSKEEKSILEERFEESIEKAKSGIGKIIKSSVNLPEQTIERKILKTVLAKESDALIDACPDQRKEIQGLVESIPKAILSENNDKDTKRQFVENSLNSLTLTRNGVKSKPTLVTDSLSKLSKSQREILQRVFSIAEDVLSKDLAHNLIEKIVERLK